MFLVRKKRRAWNFPERPVVRAPLFHYSISTRWRSRRTCAHLLLQELQNYNSLLNNRWQDNVGSHQKEIIPHIQGQRRSRSKTVGEAQSWQNQIPYPLGGWPTKMRLIITKKFSQCCEGSEPHVRLPSLGIPRESDLETQRDLITRSKSQTQLSDWTATLIFKG